MSRTAFVICRETGVLLLGLSFSLLIWLLFKQNRLLPPALRVNNPIVALFLPIILCLLRAGFVPKVAEDSSRIRAIGYQLIIALALIVLMIFEMAVALLFGAPGIPPAVWAVIALIGGSYVLLFCVADRISRTDLKYEWNPSEEERSEKEIKFDDL